MHVSLKMQSQHCLLVDSQLALCPDLDDPSNGTVSLSGASVGDTATYVCNSGFMLVGVSVLTCKDDGTWTSPPPVCHSLICMFTLLQRKTLFPATVCACVIIQMCPMPPLTTL